MEPKVYIIILNWNGWKDTIECLESVFRSSYINYQVIICDNCSDDNSLLKIEEWANGKRNAGISNHRQISKFTDPPIKKPIKYIITNQVEIFKQRFLGNTSLIMIQTGKNLGFAGGNNVGIRYAMEKDDFNYIWLLNNDTIVHKDALKNLVQYSRKHINVGICGSKLMHYYAPDIVQALGGRYNKIFGTVKHIIYSKDLKKMDYVVGASMLISKKFIKKVGLLNESYFLYYEELDWAIRSKYEFQLGCALDSIVYHKEGASINRSQNTKSEVGDYYSIKNRLAVTKKYYKIYLPTVYLGLIVTLINRIRRGQYRRVLMIINLLRGKFLL